MISQETTATTGHTSYVLLAEAHDAGPAGRAPPVEYGLATYREIWLFGAYTRTRVLDDDGNRMVFAWRDGAPDPRDALELVPTGEFAQITDRNGVAWTLYEFRYGATGPDKGGGSYAYGVPLGKVHKHGVPPEGVDDPRYNYAISYRVERLFPEPVPQPAGSADPPDAAELLQGSPDEVVAGTPEGPAEKAVRIGLGVAPVTLGAVIKRPDASVLFQSK